MFWIENDPPPLELFRKSIRFATVTHPVPALMILTVSLTVKKKHFSLRLPSQRKINIFY